MKARTDRAGNSIYNALASRLQIIIQLLQKILNKLYSQCYEIDYLLDCCEVRDLARSTERVYHNLRDKSTAS